MKAFSLISILGGAVATSASACDICAIYSAAQAHGEIGKGPFVGLAEQFSRFATVQVDGREIPNEAGQYMNSWVSQVFVGYNFTEKIGVQFNLPVIYRSFKRPDGLGEIQTGTEYGLGDVALLGNFVAYLYESKKSTFRWTVIGGVKFPTGSTRRLAEELNEIPEDELVGPASGVHGHDLTLGSGSFDGIIGTGIFVRWRQSFLTANVQYAVRSKGDLDYQFANDLTWAGGPGAFLALKDKYTVSLQAIVCGEYKGRDNFAGEIAEDTGVTAVYLGPQINFTWGDKLSAHAAVDLPMSIDNTSLQTVPDYRVRAGVTWHF